MTKRRTVLIQKYKLKGNKASNYHSITCLHLTWKLLTERTSDETYGFLENKGILLEKQRGCRGKSEGIGDNLHIDKMLLHDVKRRKKNLALGWINYQKT